MALEASLKKGPVPAGCQEETGDANAAWEYEGGNCNA